MQQKMKNKNFLPIICRKLSKKTPVFNHFYPFFAKQNKTTKNKESPIILGFLVVEIRRFELLAYALRRIQTFVNFLLFFSMIKKLKTINAGCLPIT